MQEETTFGLKAHLRIRIMASAALYVLMGGALIIGAQTIGFTLVIEILDMSTPSLLSTLVRLMLVLLLLSLGGFTIFTSALYIGAAFLTYLKISPSGMVFRQWPDFTVSCGWTDIERMGKAPSWGASYHLFWLSNVEKLEQRHVLLWLGAGPQRLLTSGTRWQFAFRNFEGWPNGELERRVRDLAPHLFS